MVQTALPGVLIIEPQVYEDERGFFLETFQKRRYIEKAGIDIEFVQDNHSRSAHGVLRGLHAQKQHPQGKLVRVTYGEVFDVAVDINLKSATFGRWEATLLSGSNARQFWIPAGYAHGFVVLSEWADFEYKCTDYYHPGDESGLVWNDPDVGIDWPISDPILTSKDKALPTLQQISRHS